MSNKTCNKCNKSLPLTEFHKASNSPDGRRYNCKKCGNTRLAIYRKEKGDAYRAMIKAWRLKNADKLKEQAKSPERKAYRKEWCKKPENKAKAAALQRKRREEVPDVRKATQRRSTLKLIYGVTEQWYDDKLAEQGNGCAICGDPTPRRKNVKYFCIDHCHSKLDVRGLLCFRCNSLLGYADDKISTLKSAIAYLVKYDSDKS